MRLPSFLPRRADGDRRPVGADGGELVDGGHRSRNERALQDEVFRRVAGDEELGECDEVDVARRPHRADGLGAVAGDIPHHGVELLDRDGEAVAHGAFNVPGLTVPVRAHRGAHV